jgi:hypothetical protein
MTNFVGREILNIFVPHVQKVEKHFGSRSFDSRTGKTAEGFTKIFSLSHCRDQRIVYEYVVVQHPVAQ